MPPSDGRRSELIAADVADQLGADERAELDVLRRADPTIDREIASLRSMMQAVAEASPGWEHVVADGALRDRVMRATGADPEPGADASVSSMTRARPPRRSRAARRRRLWVPMLAAACLAVGIGVGLGLPAVLSPTPSGPPGMLGALETVDVRESIAEGSIDAEIVAHTWGTEAILDAEGLEAGATYSIVLVGLDGTEFSAGQMLGSDVAIHCSVNAAVLRAEVARLEIRAADASVVAVADLPSI